MNKNLNVIFAALLAMAIKKNYSKFIFYKIGFNETEVYLDFHVDDIISSNDFNKIEKNIKKLLSSNLKFEKINNLNKDNNYISYSFINDNISNYVFYRINDFEFFVDKEFDNITFDIKKCKYFLINSLGGTKINNSEESLCRISLRAFETESEKNKYLEEKKDLEERDHRKINHLLDLFTFNEDVGVGLPIWLPNGYRIREKISNYLKKIALKNNFQLVSTPILGSKQLYVTSGHWDLYKENNFPPITVDNDTYLLRPMTCPHHVIIYKSKPRSYKELPIAYSENSKLHRYESRGGLIGLERVRTMELFDTHIFCRIDQINSVVNKLNKIIQEVYKKINFSVDQIDLSLKSDDKSKFYDDSNMWNMAENQLRSCLDELKLNYVEIKGEAAFYGPKIDYQYKTVLGKMITVSTIQLDFLLPKKFDINFIDDQNQLKTPVLIHFGVIGTYERFLSVILSQTKGILPFWLAPIQIAIIPINNNLHLDYANKIYSLLQENDFYVKMDDYDERISKKIFNNYSKKIPYQIIIGDKEIENNIITYREYLSDKTHEININNFIKQIKEKI